MESGQTKSFASIFGKDPEKAKEERLTKINQQIRDVSCEEISHRNTPSFDCNTIILNDLLLFLKGKINRTPNFELSFFNAEGTRRLHQNVLGKIFICSN